MMVVGALLPALLLLLALMWLAEQVFPGASLAVLVATVIAGLAWRTGCEPAALAERAPAEPVSIASASTERAPAELASVSEPSPVASTGGPPAWISDPPRLEAGRYSAVVSTDWGRIAEVERQCRSLVRAKVEEYLASLPELPAGTDFNLLFDGVENQVVRERFDETMSREVAGETVYLHRSHVRLLFDEPARQKLRGLGRDALAAQRVRTLSGMAGLLLAALAVGYAYLRLDAATRGFHRKRLKLTAGLVILGLVATAAWLA